jgi:hypothetical protein
MARTFDSPRHDTLREFLVKKYKELGLRQVDLAKRLKRQHCSTFQLSVPKARTAAIRVRMKSSVKAMAEQLAQKDARSLADWLERLIAAEAARHAGKK